MIHIELNNVIFTHLLEGVLNYERIAMNIPIENVFFFSRYDLFVLFVYNMRFIKAH